MPPILIICSFFMFTAFAVNRPYSLAYVDGLVITWAVEKVHAFFLSGRRFCLIFGTKYICELLSGCGASINACFFEAPANLVERITG